MKFKKSFRDDNRFKENVCEAVHKRDRALFIWPCPARSATMISADILTPL
jgi:hypothetical protein